MRTIIRVSVVVLAITMVTLGVYGILCFRDHLRGVRQLRHVMDVIHSHGVPTQQGELVAMLPDVDSSLQTRAWDTAWRQANGWPEITEEDGQTQMGWEFEILPMGGRWSPGKADRQCLAHMQAGAREWESILQDRRLLLTIAGSPKMRPEWKDIDDWFQVRPFNLMIARALASFWLASAAHDDGKALDYIDELEAAFHGPCCEIDVMIALSIDRIRDTAYASLAAAGRLDADRWRAWLAETSSWETRTREAWHWERAWDMPMATTVCTGQWRADGSVTNRIKMWRYGAAEEAVWLKILDDYALAGTLPDTVPHAINGNPYAVDPGVMLESLKMSLNAAQSQDVQHRLLRLAMAIALANGEAPADETEAHARCLSDMNGMWNAQGTRQAIQYERLDQHSFRLTAKEVFLTSASRVEWDRLMTQQWRKDAHVVQIPHGWGIVIHGPLLSAAAVGTSH